MPETPYFYLISTGTANGKVVPKKLVKEIRASSIVIAIERVDTGIDEAGSPNADKIKVVMKDVLSTGDETTLVNVVAAHDGIKEESHEIVELAPQVGGSGKRISGINFSFTASKYTRKEYTLSKNLHIFGNHVQWENCKLGDCAWLEVLHPLGSVDLQANALAGATEANVNVDFGGGLQSIQAYDLTNFEGDKYIEFWNSAQDQLLEIHKVTGINGDNVQFEGGLLADRNIVDTIKVKCVVGHFGFIKGINPTDVEGFELYKDSEFEVADAEYPSELMSAGSILCIVARSTAEAGTRVFVNNFLFKEEITE